MKTNKGMIWEDGLPDGVRGEDLDLAMFNYDYADSDCKSDTNAGFNFNNIMDLMIWVEIMEWELRGIQRFSL